METLLEDYKRKLKTAESMLENGMTFGDEQENRIKIKASVYRSAIVDIERAMARQQQQSSANCAIFDVSGSLPSNRELEDFVENISRQIELEPADDLWAKMCLTYNFVKAYVERKRQ